MNERLKSAANYIGSHKRNVAIVIFTGISNYFGGRVILNIYQRLDSEDRKAKALGAMVTEIIKKDETNTQTICTQNLTIKGLQGDAMAIQQQNDGYCAGVVKAEEDYWNKITSEAGLGPAK